MLTQGPYHSSNKYSDAQELQSPLGLVGVLISLSICLASSFDGHTWVKGTLSLQLLSKSSRRDMTLVMSTMPRAGSMGLISVRTTVLRYLSVLRLNYFQHVHWCRLFPRLCWNSPLPWQWSWTGSPTTSLASMCSVHVINCKHQCSSVIAGWTTCNAGTASIDNLPICFVKCNFFCMPLIFVRVTLLHEWCNRWRYWSCHELIGIALSLSWTACTTSQMASMQSHALCVVFQL